MAVKAGREEQDEEVRFDLPVSTIDVVFLLLIFFMCTARFKQTEKILDANLPHEGGPEQRDDLTPVDPIHVKLWSDSAGRLAIGINSRENRVADIHELASRLAVLQRTMDGLSVLIDARRDVQYRHVIAAMDACKRAQIESVKFALAPEALRGTF